MLDLVAQPISVLTNPPVLSAANRLVFDYWQSLRRDGDLPDRADFNPARVAPTLSRLCLFDVKPGERLVCRLGGSLIAKALGADLSGMDYRDYTPPAYQAMRMNVHERILGGEAMCNVRGAALTTGKHWQWQELLLPFGDMREDGSRQIIVAADFREPEYGEHVVSIAETMGAPISASFVAL